MVLDIIVLIAWMGTALMVWRLVMTKSARPGARPRRSGPVTGEQSRSPSTPVAACDELTMRWADPALVWQALDIENQLLQARMSGWMTAARYRSSLTDLAWRCEPATAGPERVQPPVNEGDETDPT